MKTNQKIPEGWSVKKLRDITTLLTNGFVGSATPHYTENENGIIYIQGFNVKTNSFDLTGIKKVTPDFHKKNAKSCLQEGDLLTVQTGDIGVTARVPKCLAGSNCHALIISRFNKEICDSRFYLQYYNSSICQTRFKKIETGSTMKHINVGDLEAEYVPLPPLPEQEKIAEILGTWDTAIEKLSALIEQKKQLKKGLMQRLLTGKQRLPGFSAPWKKVKLGDVALLFSGGTPSKEEPLYWENGHIKWLSEKYIENDKIIGWDYITDEGLEKSSAKTTQVNDIILVTRVSVGKIYFCQERYAVNQDLTVIRAKNISSNFLFFLIKNKQNLIIDKSQGLAIKGITKEELSNISFLLPPLPEQKAIADILSKADEEIALLTRKLSALKTQKTGLMQKLLTGQIRVKVNQA